MTFECVSNYVDQVHNIHGFFNAKDFKVKRRRANVNTEKSISRDDIIDFMVNRKYYKVPGY